METKVRLNDVDIRLLKRVSNITGIETGIDQDGWIDVDILLATLDDLEDKYSDLEDRYYNYTHQETSEDYIWNREFDRGFHPHEYE